jgi:drug/metabolite transporter (DMT)-like permease
MSSGGKSFSHWRDLFLLLLCNLMFGAQYPAMKMAVIDFGPPLLSLMTLLLGALCLVPFYLLETKSNTGQERIYNLLRGKNLFPFLMVTVAGLLPGSVVLAWGIERSLASNAALLTLMIPIFTALLAAMVRKERMSRWRWISFFLGVTGAALSSEIQWGSVNVFNSTYLVGNALILIGCAGSAFTNVFSKGLLERFRPVRLLIGSYCFTAFLCLLLSLESVNWRTFSSVSLRTWIGLAILGMFPFGLAMVIFFRVLTRLEVTQVSLSIYLLPFFGVLLSALILKERITPHAIMGGILVLIGTTLILLKDRMD